MPWNRGGDPNFWSFLEGSPKGVTIHQVSPGLDRGPILLQEEAHFSEHETLRSTYDHLTDRIQALFRENWPRLKSQEITPSPQLSGGTYHRYADIEPYRHLLTDGWDTPVRVLRAHGEAHGLTVTPQDD